jgi:uncharacterized membrane protein YfcA
VDLSPLGALAVVGAGMAAGTVNAVVGSGSLITFPTLIGLGYPALLANVSNNIGLVPGGASAVVGYRRELRGQRARVVRLASASLAGGLTGSILLLALPESVFDAVVPGLVLLGVVLVAVQPRVAAWLAARRGDDAHDDGGAALLAGAFLTGVYGGYFGAGQGIILLALLGILLDDDLQRLNGVKNVLAMLVNGVAAIVFVVVADVAWDVVALIAVGSVVGGQLGAMFGRRLPPDVLRVLVIVVGLAAVVRLLV